MQKRIGAIQVKPVLRKTLSCDVEDAAAALLVRAKARRGQVLLDGWNGAQWMCGDPCPDSPHVD